MSLVRPFHVSGALTLIGLFFSMDSFAAIALASFMDMEKSPWIALLPVSSYVKA